ncbi:MAG: hypothetical protein JNJ98_09720 [Gemmatimonadetes bacterium]|nr:hypothetical protein [Gemmatimonadota bacterium]
MWRGDRTPPGASITYRLTQPLAQAPRVVVVNALGDTVARLTGPNRAGLHTVTWNLLSGPAGGPGGGGGGGGRGTALDGSGIADPGFPRGFNPRPAESRAAPDSSGTPEAVRRRLASPPAGGGGPGGFGGGGGGFNAARAVPVAAGDYRLVLLGGETTSTQRVRVVPVDPDDRSVLAPGRR